MSDLREKGVGEKKRLRERKSVYQAEAILFFFLATTMACGSSQARDRTCTTAATPAAAVTTPDP